MNIFILDLDPAKCARYHCDKHVIKMLLEAAQMLCTVAGSYGYAVPYKPTHKNHPCTLWVAESIENWHWLVRLSLELNKEYRYRFAHDVDHKSWTVIKKLQSPKLPQIKQTPFVLVMPEVYKALTDPVIAYRKFYVAEKNHICNWSKRRVPCWFNGR